MNIQFSSFHSIVSYSLQPHESQHARPPCPSPTPGVHSDSRPLSERCHLAISSSVITWLATFNSYLFDNSHLTGVRRHLIVVLIFLLISDIKHLFMYLLTICITSLKKCQFRSPVHFLIRLFVFMLLSCMCSLYVLNINLIR